MSHTFTPHPLYRWLTLLCLVFSGLLGWSLVQSVAPEEIFFLGISLSAGVWFANTMLSRVALNERTLVLQQPLHGVREVEFRQLVSVTESGRFTQSLSVLYYPRQPDSLLDLERIHHLSLPAVTDQERLLMAIEARIPT
ncbi:MAG: hypothetical protein R3E79_52230 [Caldilineaceae bacterium]